MVETQEERIGFVLAGILLLVAVVLITSGVIRQKSIKDTSVSQTTDVTKKDDETLVGDYFDKSKISRDTDDYRANDPFNEICNKANPEGAEMVIYSNTVCFK